MMPEWSYTYHSSDGIRHEARIRAPKRDAAFALLRGRGIRPIKLYPAPGLLNRLRISGWRWVASSVLVMLALGAAVYGGGRASARQGMQDILPRHRLAGLPGDWYHRLDKYLPPADAYLALFAQPGYMEEDGSGRVQLTVEDLLREVPPPTIGDPAWIVTLKRVLAGMKEEAATLVKLGKAPSEIAVWLEERQKMEAAYRRQILEGDGSDEEKHRRQRAMGL